MVKIRSLYLTWAWYTLGRVRQTNGQTDRQKSHS